MMYDNVHCRAGAERELRNLISQVQGHKQEREKSDDVSQRENKVNNFSDRKSMNLRPDQGQLQVRQDKSNAQDSAARQTAQQTTNSAEETAKIGNSRYHSGCGRDSSRI